MPRLILPGYRERLDVALKAKGLNQLQLAQATGLSQQNLSRWFNGGLPQKLSDLERLADFLGAPWQWFLVGEEGAKAIEGYVRTRRPAPKKKS